MKQPDVDQLRFDVASRGGAELRVGHSSRDRRARLATLVGEAMEATGPRSVLIVVPSPVARERHVRALLRRNPRGVWLPEIVSLDTLAERAARGQPACPPLTGDAVRRTILAELLRRSGRGVLRTLAMDASGWVRSLDHFFQSLARQKIWSRAHLASLLVRYRGRDLLPVDEEILVLYDAYRRVFPAPGKPEPALANALRGRLESQGRLAMDPAPFREALGGVELAVFDGFESLSPLQADLIGVIVRLVPRAIVHVESLRRAPGDLEPESVDDVVGALRAAARRAIAEDAPLDAVAEAASALAREDLDALAATRPSVPLERFTMTAYPDALREVQAIAARLRSRFEGGSDDAGGVAVSFASPERYLPLVREVFPRFGIPFRAYPGIPLASVPPVSLRLALLRMVAGGYRREEVEPVLGTCYFACADDARRAFRLACEARVRGGRGDPAREWLEPIRQLVAARASEVPAFEPDGPADSTSRDVEAVTYLERFFEALRPLAVIRRERSDAAALRAALEAAVLPLFAAPLEACEGDLGLALERDRRAVELFDARLGELERASARLDPAPFLDLDGWIQRLETLLSEETVAPMEENERGVVVIGLADLRHLDAEVVYVGGLSEGSFPHAPHRQPFYPETGDRDRDFLHHVDPVTEGTHGLLREVVLRGGVHLSWPSRVGEVEQLPSALLDRLHDVLEVGALPALAPEPTGSAVRGAFGARVLADQDRCAPGRFTGFLGDSAFPASAGAAFLPGGPHVHAVSALERYAQCGYHFFARDVLGLGEPDEVEDEISARTRGSLLHEILRAFHAPRLGRPLLVPLDDAGNARLREELRQIAERALANVPTGDLLSRAARASFLAGLGDRAPTSRRIGVLAAFLDAEITRAREGWSPEAVEWSFGGRGGAGAVAIETPEGEVRVRGKIDRVDRHLDRSRLVLDYKSGATPAAVDAALGIRFQLAIYLHAYRRANPDIDALLWNAAYYGLRPGNMEPRSYVYEPAVVSAQADAAMVALGERLGRLTRAIAAGSFPLTVLSESKAPCRHCAYGSLCRVDRLRWRARREAYAAARDVYLPDERDEAGGDGETHIEEGAR